MDAIKNKEIKTGCLAALHSQHLKGYNIFNAFAGYSNGEVDTFVPKSGAKSTVQH